MLISRFFQSRATAAILMFTIGVSVIAYPKRSEAMVTMTVGFPVAVIVGGLAFCTSGGLSAGVELTLQGDAASFKNGFGLYSAVALLGGFVLLDSDQGQTLRFIPITAEQAQRVGISEVERTSFNSQTDELNSVAQSVQADIENSEVHSPQEGLALARSLWNQQKTSIDPDAFSAAEKLSNAAINH